MYANSAGAETGRFVESGAVEAEARGEQAALGVQQTEKQVDRVKVLLERVERQEKAIGIVIAERDRIMDCCEKQKEMIALLQEKLRSQFPVTESSRRLSEYPKSSARVNSMRGALLRIRGVDVELDVPTTDAGYRDAEAYEAFDASEFQPITADNQGMASAFRSLLGRVSAGVSRMCVWLGAKRDAVAIESDGVQIQR